MTNLLVEVRDGDVEGALKRLKKLFAMSGLARELKTRTSYMKPSMKRRRKSELARKQIRKAAKRRNIAVEEREQRGISTY